MVIEREVGDVPNLLTANFEKLDQKVDKPVTSLKVKN